MIRTTDNIAGSTLGAGGQILVSERRPTSSSGARDSSDESEPPPEDSLRQMRSEVNAYASAILLKLLSIVTRIPEERGDEARGIEQEIRQMLAFIDPSMSHDLSEQIPAGPASETTGPRHGNADQTFTQLDARIETLIEQQREADRGAAESSELLRELRSTLFALRDDVTKQQEATTSAIQSLTSTTRSLHYTITALAARTEQVTDVTGIAEEQLRVGVWKYAMIAGLSSGAVVAAIIGFISLAV